MKAKQLGVGIVGCGNISGIYLRNISRMFSHLELRACADALPEKAEAAGKKWDVPALTTEELVARDDVDIVLNLTTPPFHASVNRMALEAGKHAYCEKPFALDMEEARDILALAEKKRLRVGGAPDTFLGSAFQTCRQLIDDGAIGKPLSAFAAMNCPGHERWHPAPDFYYKPGGGPMLDMGPYYLTVLVSLLGPVASVQALTSAGFDERILGAGPRKGETVTVEVPTQYQGLMKFENGVTGSIIMSFDTWRSEQPRLEIHGTEGSLLIPDPNRFGGAVRLLRAGESRLKKIGTRSFPYRWNSRGLGVADMAHNILKDRPHRADGRMAAHVLETMLAFDEAGKTGSAVDIRSTMDRPAPLKSGLKKGEIA